VRIYVTHEEIDLLNRATNTWGVNFQEEMVVEECAELITAIRHFNRGKISHEELITELADVLIVCSQFALNLDMVLVEDEIEQKLERLRKKVRTGNHANA